MFIVKEPPSKWSQNSPQTIVSQKTLLKKLPPSPKQITFLTTVPQKSSTLPPSEKCPQQKQLKSVDPEYNPRTTCRRKITPYQISTCVTSSLFKFYLSLAKWYHATSFMVRLKTTQCKLSRVRKYLSFQTWHSKM